MLFPGYVSEFHLALACLQANFSPFFSLFSRFPFVGGQTPMTPSDLAELLGGMVQFMEVGCKP
jgi:hypothetical protein